MNIDNDIGIINLWERIKEISTSCNTRVSLNDSFKFFDGKTCIGDYDTVDEAFAFICGYSIDHIKKL